MHSLTPDNELYLFIHTTVRFLWLMSFAVSPAIRIIIINEFIHWVSWEGQWLLVKQKKLFFISVNESLTSSSIINAQEIFFIFVEKCKSFILQYAADLPPANLVISDLNSLFCCALMRKQWNADSCCAIKLQLLHHRESEKEREMKKDVVVNSKFGFNPAPSTHTHISILAASSRGSFLHCLLSIK